jgi:3-oxoacyl-[acyl-carrier protein] reductase
MIPGLSGKVAMVGGASRGLGYAVAHALAREGAHVSLAARNTDALTCAASRLGRETGAEVVAVPTDLSAPGDIERWYATTAERFGGVDLLLCNTGGPPAGPALAFDDAGWNAAFAQLVLSVIRLVRLVVPAMKQRGGGSIVMATSSAVKEPIPNLALSNVLRAPVSALAKTLALELAPSNIRVNQIIPGRIDTDRVRQLDETNGRRNGLTADEQRGRSMATIPMGRYGTPEEFGNVAAFLLSDAASYMTGASILVDGGLTRSVM